MSNIITKLSKPEAKKVEGRKDLPAGAETLANVLAQGKDASIHDIDRIRGMFPHLKDKDLLEMPKAELMPIYPKRWGGTKDTVTTKVTVIRNGERREQEIPASLFARMSTSEEENEVLLKDPENELGSQLLSAMPDTQRLAKVAGKTILVSSPLSLRTAKFQKNGDKYEILPITEECHDLVKCYRFKEVKVTYKP